VDKFLVTPRALSPAAACRAVLRRDCGAVALFAGTVRDRHDGRRVRRIAYSAFAGMARREFARYAAEARRKWKGIGAVYVAHRVGRLRYREASVLVAVSAVHRAEAFAACRHIMERVKQRAPVWKEEHYAGGGRAWIENRRG
jgi:molybdopterin synthase catalytic subunit